jgi:hypothetical protein
VAKARGDAKFSADSHYRFLLTRTWSELGLRGVTFIGLMPGVTGDSINDDRVSRQCRALATSWGMDHFEIVNLFGRCVPSWEDLEYQQDPVGYREWLDNDRFIFDSCRRSMLTICAWGSKGELNGRGGEVLQLVRLAGRVPMCVAQTDGHPWPVVFVDSDCEPRRYEP